MNKFRKVIYLLLSLFNINVKLEGALKSQIVKNNSAILTNNGGNEEKYLNHKAIILGFIGLPLIVSQIYNNKSVVNKNELDEILNSSEKHNKLINILNKEPANLNIFIGRDECLYIVGDIHGSMKSILKLNSVFAKDLENKKCKVLFLGDIVDDKSGYKNDRMGILPFLYICNLKLRYPDRVFILCGNHEASYGLGMQSNRFYKIDYTNEQKIKLCEILSNLPICATITCGNKRYFAVHGCPYANTDLNSLSKININVNSHSKWPDKSRLPEIFALEILWNDYKDNIHGFKGSTKEDVEEFMKKNNFQYIFKAHQHDRMTLEKDEKVYTIISFKNESIYARYAVLKNENVEINPINI